MRWTPLQDLVRPRDESERNGHFIAQATFLLDRDADVNALSAQGETALDIAVHLGNETSRRSSANVPAKGSAANGE